LSVFSAVCIHGTDTYNRRTDGHVFSDVYRVRDALKHGSVVVGVGDGNVDRHEAGFGRNSTINSRQHEAVVGRSFVIKSAGHSEFQRSARIGSRHQAECRVVVAGHDEVTLTNNSNKQ